MSAVLILVNILLALVALVLIVSVLAQEGTRQGLGAITGGAETFFGKNKAKSIEGKLEMITKIGAAAFIVLAIVSTMITSALNPAETPNYHIHEDGTIHYEETETEGTETTEGTVEEEHDHDHDHETEGEAAQTETTGEAETDADAETSAEGESEEA
ncbi:MAG: preprotein translocase subunit SecG [Eubacteriales bacterium]|nr:preprotein translocase subunit SecG [Eubacteriales bacterium]